MKPVVVHRAPRCFLATLLAALALIMAGAAPAAAQYGGISGLFVTSSPERPGFADFTGLGCNGGEEVVLYFPGLAPTNQDPTASQSVPGRILAVTTSVISDDPQLNGTFAFSNVRLPTDVEPGVYEVHSRCGSRDLRVLIEIGSDGQITINPDPTAPINNETPESGAPPGALPFTGRSSNRLLSLAAGMIAAGVAAVAASRRHLRYAR